VGVEHLETVVKNPRYGYGSNMNPCIDCHAYMLKKAGELMESGGFDFLFTGEVLGQRPMSQNRQALGLVAKASGLPQAVLRPLSARRLPATPMEQEGLVDRELLLDLTGRSRKPQMALARELGVKDYPAPAGGCLLTEPGFSRRLKDLLDHQPDCDAAQVELLKHGRHLRLSPRAMLVVGRNQGENKTREELAPAGALHLAAEGYPGPLGLYQGPDQGPDLELAAAVTAGYGKAPLGQPVAVRVGDGPGLTVDPLPRRKAHGMLL
jgi:tRNA U34 2-thiouridine synthase MnmA/TrmU